MTNTVALVSGASRGIGAAIARGLAGRGHHVIVNYHRNADAAKRVVADVEAKPLPRNRHSDLFHSECPVRTVFDRITSRWAPLVLVKLAEGPLRFYELRDQIGGISEKVLSEKLRLLTRDGLVDRTVEPTIPPRVSYALTDTGHSLAKPLRQLMRWVADHGEAVLAAHERHDDQN